MACEPFLDGCLARETPEGACSLAVDAANELVAASVDAIAPFFCPGSRCETIRGMVTFGPPAVTSYSLVAAWVETIEPRLNDGQVFMPGVLVATIGMQLWVDGFPVGEVQGDTWYPPAPDLVVEAATLASVLGETWYRKVVTTVAANSRPDQRWRSEALTPLPQTGSFIGWETGFTVELQ